MQLTLNMHVNRPVQQRDIQLEGVRELIEHYVYITLSNNAK